MLLLHKNEKVMRVRCRRASKQCNSLGRQLLSFRNGILRKCNRTDRLADAYFVFENVVSRNTEVVVKHKCNKDIEHTSINLISYLEWFLFIEADLLHWSYVAVCVHHNAYRCPR